MVKTPEQAAVQQMLHDALEAIVRGDMAPFWEMFHEDGVMEYPFRPPGPPDRIAGKPAIKDGLSHYTDHLKVHRIIHHATHHADGVMVAEFATDGTAVATGNDFHQTYVAVVAYEGGKIKSYRDYWDPLVAVKALGGLEALGTMGKTGGQ